MTADDERFARARDAVGRVVGPRAAAGRIAELPGISHRSYRVEIAEDVLVVKLREDGAAQVLDVAEEFRVHERAAAAGVAPEAVAFDAAAGALVTRFVDGAEALRAERMREPATIERLAALLDALHGVPAGRVPRFTAEAHARRYVDAAERARELDAADRGLADELVALGADVDALDAACVLCHTDLVASNVLDSGRLWLIDFEYAARADPVVDLASLAAMNRFAADECRALLEAYAAAAARPWAAREFDKVVRLLKLLAYFWADAEAARTGSRAELDEFRGRDELLE